MFKSKGGSFFDMIAKSQASKRRNTILRDQLIAEGKITGGEASKPTAKQAAFNKKLDARMQELGILHGRSNRNAPEPGT